MEFTEECGSQTQSARPRQESLVGAGGRFAGSAAWTVSGVQLTRRRHRAGTALRPARGCPRALWFRGASTRWLTASPHLCVCWVGAGATAGVMVWGHFKEFLGITAQGRYPQRPRDWTVEKPLDSLRPDHTRNTGPILDDRTRVPSSLDPQPCSECKGSPRVARGQPVPHTPLLRGRTLRTESSWVGWVEPPTLQTLQPFLQGPGGCWDANT